MKKTLVILLVMATLICLIPILAINAAENVALTITNENEYLAFAKNPVSGLVKVTADLDFTGRTDYAPIGSLNNTVLDFDGHTVKGINYTNNAAGNDAGMIANAMSNSGVKNLVLKDSTITIGKNGAGDTFLGAIVGWCNSSYVTDITLENVTLNSSCNGVGQNGGVGGLIGAKDGDYATSTEMKNIKINGLTINAPQTDAAFVINRLGKGNNTAVDLVIKDVEIAKASVTSNNVSAGVSSVLVYQNNLVDAGYSLSVRENTVTLGEVTYNSKIAGAGSYVAYYQTRAGKKSGTVDFRIIVVASKEWLSAMGAANGSVDFKATFKSTNGTDTKSFDLSTDTVYGSIEAKNGNITDKYSAAEGNYIFGWVVTGVPEAYASESGAYSPDLLLQFSQEDNKTYVNENFDGKTLKVLAIGNSFSDDSMEWLYKIAKAEGVETIVLGNLYWGGCDLQTHVYNSQNAVAQYSYRKNTNDQWVTRENSTLEYGIKDEDWDIITMQQVSGKSGVYSSYTPYLQQLVDYVNATKTNPDCVFAWNMTWAYQSDSTHGDFPTYNRNQMTMYNNIVSSVRMGITTRDDFPIILTPGTAIQNARTSFLGDTLTRDGYHLNYDIGRYIAGYTWFRILTGKELTELKYTHDFDAVTLKMVLEAVNAAATNPFSVTPSSYAEYGINLDDYVALDYDYTVGGYWQSDSAENFNRVVTEAGNSVSFLATELFNKNTLPAGSLIVVDAGYQYRPERWDAEAGVQTNRPGNTSVQYYVIPEDWWNGYTYRAFNVSATNGSAATADFATHFRLYVPKGVTVSDENVSFPRTVIKDLSSNKNSGDIVGSIEADQTSPNGYVVDGYFISTDLNGNVNAAISGTGNFTIGAYVRLKDLNANNVILAKGDRQVTIKIDGNGRLEFFTYTVETQWAPIINGKTPAAAGISANEWVYLVGVREGSNLYLYVNGELVGTATNASGTVNVDASANFGIGADPSTGRYGRNCYAYAHVLNYAATQAEIKATYEALKAGNADGGAYTAEDAVMWYDSSKFENQ